MLVVFLNFLFLGDSGYPQRSYMMTPIVGATRGSAEEHYTKLHCVARNTVERTIGILKNRWRCILGHRVLHYHPDTAAKIINACCVLHNICNKVRLGEDDIEEALLSTEQIQSQMVDGGQEVIEQSTSDELRRGLEGRVQLVQELWVARHLH